MVYGYIYKLTAPDGRIYIGQTKNIKRRWNRHERNSKQNHLAYISKAIKKYGWDNFKKEIIHEAQSFEELNLLEIKYIKELNSINRNIGFNQATGGHVWKHSDWDEETKKKARIKLSKRMSGVKNPMSLESIAERNNCSIEYARKLTPGYNRQASEYCRKRASETHKGKLLSKETKEKIIKKNLKYKYIITNIETDQVFETKNLNQWCKDNNVSYGILIHRVTKKEVRTRRSFKEWNIERILYG